MSVAINYISIGHHYRMIAKIAGGRPKHFFNITLLLWLRPSKRSSGGYRKTHPGQVTEISLWKASKLFLHSYVKNIDWLINNASQCILGISPFVSAFSFDRYLDIAYIYYRNSKRVKPIACLTLSKGKKCHEYQACIVCSCCIRTIPMIIYENEEASTNPWSLGSFGHYSWKLN